MACIDDIKIDDYKDHTDLMYGIYVLKYNGTVIDLGIKSRNIISINSILVKLKENTKAGGVLIIIGKKQ